MRFAGRLISMISLGKLFVPALCAGIFFQAQVAEAGMTFRLSNQFPPSHHVSVGMQVFAEKIKVYSNGEMTVTVGDSSQFFRDTEIVKALRDGAVEVGLVPVNKWSGLVPAVDIFEVPFAFKDLSSLKVFLDNGAAGLFDEAFSRFGTKVLFWVDYGYVQFFNSKQPLTMPSDFKGLTMRAFSAGDSAILKALGAAPTIMSSAELYMALKQGTVAGTTTGMPAAVSRKVIEVQKYMTLANYSTAEFLVQANLKWWNGLTDPQREVIVKASADAEAFIREKVAEAEDEALIAVKAAGVDVYEINAQERQAFIKATEPVRREYLKKSGDLGAKLLPVADTL